MVVEIAGGWGIRSRLDRLGIREGTMLTAVRAPGMGGPAMVAVGGSQVAVGFGMAERILVEVDRE